MADVLSRFNVDAIWPTKGVDLLDIEHLQIGESSLTVCNEHSSLMLKSVPMPHYDSSIMCDISTATHKLFVSVM